MGFKNVTHSLYVNPKTSLLKDQQATDLNRRNLVNLLLIIDETPADGEVERVDQVLQRPGDRVTSGAFQVEPEAGFLESRRKLLVGGGTVGDPRLAVAQRRRRKLVVLKH